jgi:hypothetical protein
MAFSEENALRHSKLTRESSWPYLMDEWKEQAEGVNFGSWVAEQLLENTECDVTAHLEEAFSHIAGKWRWRRRRTRVDEG